MAEYRMVLFVPDPFSGARFPIAALVQDAGKVSVVHAPHIPCATCLGGENAAAVVQIILSDLVGVTTIDELPESIGPHAMLGDRRGIPNHVVVYGESTKIEGDAAKWLERAWRLWTHG